MDQITIHCKYVDEHENDPAVVLAQSSGEGMCNIPVCVYRRVPDLFWGYH